MPTRSVQSTVVVPFSVDGQDGVDQIILEQSNEWTRQPGFGSIAVREFPVLNGVTRAASVGQIINTGYTVQLNRSEFLKFDGDTANTRYPLLAASATFNTVFAFTQDGRTLSPGSLSFSYTPGSTEIRANRPFIGAVNINYYTAYRLLSYTPQGYDGRLSNAGFQVIGSLVNNYGAIISVAGSVSAVLEIDPRQIDEDAGLRKELYRVVSTIQVNENGPWEKSPDFDSGGGWAAAGSPRDGDNLFEYERVHEIGYLNRLASGRVDFETTTFFLEQGPVGNFIPDYRGSFQSASVFEGTPWQDSYARVDQGSLQSDINVRFGAGNVTYS